jgi:hypothetical protein
MKKIILITLLAIFFSVGLVGCGEIEEVTVTIARIETEATEWGCIGTDKRTIVKTEDNKMDDICGEWGEPGDKIKGYWKSGHPDPSANGFRRTN